jgi:hypothetical protein
MMKASLRVAAIFFSFYSSFPMVYGEKGYGFSLGVSTLPFLALLVGAFLGYMLYAIWNR